MSSAPEIEVAVETPERVMFDLQRMVDLDFTHGQKHKAEGNMDSCHICVKLRNQIKFYAANKTQLSMVGELVERTAKTLSRQEAGVKWHVVGYDHDFYWDTVRTVQARNRFRRRATELVYDLFGSELKFWNA
jgi:rhamnogalacturonyl hydrolase YesR